MRMTKTSRRGFTLVELLIVLLILAIMTTVAIQATSGLVDQARYETTQRNLQNIQDAIIGPTNQRASDGSLLITGFAADMGACPNWLTRPAIPFVNFGMRRSFPPRHGMGSNRFRFRC